MRRFLYLVYCCLLSSQFMAMRAYAENVLYCAKLLQRQIDENTEIVGSPLQHRLLGYLKTARRDCYTEGVCQANVSSLIDLIREHEGENFLFAAKAKVLYIHEADFKYVMPNEPAKPAPEGWRWHSVLEVYGYILDLDYKTQAELPLVRDYLSIMYGPIDTRPYAQNLVIRAVPISESIRLGTPITPVWESIATSGGWPGVASNEKDQHLLWQFKGIVPEYYSSYVNAYQFMLTKNSYDRYPPISINNYVKGVK